MLSIVSSNLGRRIVLLVGVSVSLMTVALVISGSLAVRESLERFSHERKALAQVTASHLDYILRQNIASLNSVQFAQGVDIADGNLEPEKRALHSTYLGSIFDDGVFITDQTGKVLWSEPYRQDLVNANISAYPPVSLALSEVRPSISNVLTIQPGGQKVIMAVTPLRDAAGRIVGLVGGQIDPTRLTLREFAASAGMADGSYIDVIDHNAVVLASSDIHRTLKTDGARDAQGREVAGLARLTVAPWSVAVMQSKQDAQAPVMAMQQRFVVFGLLALVVAFFFTWGMARSLLKPIEQLTGAAQRISSGDLSQPIPHNTSDEIGELGRSFDAMREALRKSIAEVTEANRGLEAKVEERTRRLEESYREIERKEAARGELLRRVLGVQEEERKRIARELHDQTTQSILALAMRLDAVSKSEEIPAGVRESLAGIKDLSTRTLDSVHQIIFDLRPSVLDDLGLLSALRWLGEKRLAPLSVNVRVEVTGEERKLPPTVEIALFRVVQEAITNIARHAEARNVVISVELKESAILIEIEDDGKGFDVAAIGPAGEARGVGLGLMGMKERVALLGGRFGIESRPGEGTRLAVEVPLEPGARP